MKTSCCLILSAALGCGASFLAFGKGLPANYYQVAYLQSQNGAYVDTGYLVDTAKTSIEIKMDASTAATSGYPYLFGVRDEEGVHYAASKCFYCKSGGSNMSYALRSYSKEESTGAFASYNQRLTIDLSYEDKVFTIDWVNTTKDTSGTKIIDTNAKDYVFENTMYVFSANCMGTAGDAIPNVFLKRMKIFESGELVHDLVPARLRDDASYCGLFDLVTRKCFRNVNTVGAFLCGDVVLDDVPYEDEPEEPEIDKTGGPLYITATKGLYGTPDPAYGLIEGWEIGTNVTLTCTDAVTTGDVHYVCTGWKRYTSDDKVTWTLAEQGTGTSIDYTHVKQGQKIEWQWQFVDADISRGLPKDYQQVAWLQSADTAYVDTEYFVDTAKTQLELKMDVSTACVGDGYSYLFGALDEGDKVGVAKHFYCRSAGWNIGFNLRSYSEEKWKNLATYNQWLSINSSYKDKIFSLDYTNLTTQVKGDYVWDSKAVDYTFENTLYLFSANRLGTALAVDVGMRVKRMRIIEDNQVVCDLVPVRLRADASVRGFYDIRRRKFYGNANSTGSFSIGEDVKDVPRESGLVIMFY